MSVTLQELFDAGAHLGHQAQKWHPRIKPWIYCAQDGIHIFDLEKTEVQLAKAKERIKQLKADGKSVVVVATKKQASETVQELAEKAGVMYVINRWPGGLITNWEQVRKSIKRMNEIETGLAGDTYREYTKYERLLLEKQLNRLKRLFGGVKNLKNKPDALFVVDGMKEKNAVHEAIKEHVEIIALVDSNTDPTGMALPVPANDDALSSITLIVAEALGVKEEGVVAVAAKVEEKAAEKKPEAEVETKEEVKEEAKTEVKAEKKVAKEAVVEPEAKPVASAAKKAKVAQEAPTTAKKAAVKKKVTKKTTAK